MKKITIVFILIAFSITASAQRAYYWRGIIAGGAWTTTSNWNLAIDGSSNSRTTPDVGDTLIFDGTASNFSGSSATSPLGVTAVPYQTIKNLIFRNNAFVKFTTSGCIAGTGTTAAGTLNGVSGSYTGQTVVGTGTSFSSLFANGDFISTGTANTGTGGVGSVGQVVAITSNTSLVQTNGNLAMVATNGTSVFYIKDAMVRITNALSVDATSYFEMAASAPLIFKLNEAAKGDVYGTVNISANFQKLVVVDSNNTASLTFYNGSKFQFAGSQSTAPFDGLANTNNNNVIFKYGSIYENNATAGASTNSCGSFYGAIIPFSVVSFEKGSTFVQNVSGSSGMVGSPYRFLPNVLLNGATSGLAATLPVDTLTISANTTWTINSNSFFPIKGDFIMNGSYIGAAQTPVFIFCGNGIQNIKVTGTMTSGGFNKFIISPNSTLKLGSNIVQSTNNNTTSYTRVFGGINFDTYTLSAASTTSNTLQGYNSTTTVTAKDSVGVVSASTPYLITFPYALGSGMQQGLQITGDSVPSNTVIITTSGSTVTTSNPIKPGTSIKISTNVNPNGPTFTTANSAGIGGSYPNTPATFNFPFGVGSNFIFNAATTKPFPITTNNSVYNTVYANALTLAGNVTSNVFNVNVNGTLNLGGNTLTIPEADTVRIVSGNAVQGASATKFIALGVNTTTGARGALSIGNINSATLFPIGANGNYLPVTITPAGANEDYTVSAFNGITTNSTPNGTAFTAAQKANVVDAVWTISTATFTPTIQVAWPASLEGSNFTNYGNSIGIAKYNTTWGAPVGSGDNVANTATTTNNINGFGAFAVGRLGSTLPVKFSNISASLTNGNNAKITWDVATEINIDNYRIEASKDGVSFVEKGAVKATGSSNYTFIDASSLGITNYYRVKAVDKSGAITYSSTVKLATLVSVTSAVSIYPNPVIGSTINIFIANTNKENYALQLVDNAGKIVLNKSISHNGGAASYTVDLLTILASGSYHLLITTASQNITKTVLIK